MTSISLHSHNKKENSAVFLLKNSSASFVNALRRTIMMQVPTMAIDEVEFVKNSSALYDEMVAHRLGLVPLSTDLKTYTPLDKCDGVLSAKNSVKLWLKAKGPGYVTADQIQSKDPAVKPVLGKLPIVKLLDDQELEFEATAVLSRGVEHTKWSPAHCWHTKVASVKVKQGHPQFAEFKDKYPPQIIKNGKIDEKKIEELNLFDAVDGVNNEIVTVTYAEKDFLLHVESHGQLNVKDVVVTALGRLKEQFESLEV